MRVNHSYGPGGALAYLAAYDVHAAKVFGRTEERTGIVPFMNLATQVMSQEPYPVGGGHRCRSLHHELTPPDGAAPQREHSGRHSPAAVHLLYGTPRPQMGAVGFYFTIDDVMGLSNVPRSNGERPTCASARS